jgi:hypothetical protein
MDTYSNFDELDYYENHIGVMTQVAQSRSQAYFFTDEFYDFIRSISFE